MLERHMQEFARELDVSPEDLRKSPTEYVIPVEEQLAISLLSTSEGGMLLRCEAIPYSDRNSALLAEALYGNLFGRVTRGAVLGLNEEENLLTLSKAVEYTADYRQFRDEIEDFINVAQFWRNESISTSSKIA